MNIQYLILPELPRAADFNFTTLPNNFYILQFFATNRYLLGQKAVSRCA